MRKYKRAEFSTTTLMQVILAIAAVSVLIVLAVNLLDNGSRKQESASDSYFDSFMREVELADDGQVGEFVMWQDSEDVGKQDVFLIYFGKKFNIDLPNDMTFITYGRENIICACYWNGEEGICKDENCENLDYPILYESGGPDDQWYIGNKQGITIEREGEEYIVNEIQES